MIRLAAALGFLLLSLCATASAQVPFADCTTESFANKIGRPEVFKCVEMRRFDSELAGATVPVRTLRTTEDERSTQYEPDVVDAIETAFQHFAQLGGLGHGSVSVVFDLPLPESVKGGYAAAGMLDAENSPECVILVNTVRHDTDPNAAQSGDVLLELRNTVAHELFHCVQYWTWPKKMPRAVGKDAKWWVEATAELMGHLVAESSGTLLARADQFAQLSRTQPLTTIEYPNVVFFSWLWARGGPGALVDFINAMPEEPGEEKQRAALVGEVGDTFLAQFVTDYADGKIKSPSGTAIPAPTGVVQRMLDSAGPFVMQVPPLTAFINDVSFEGGMFMATTSGTPLLYYKPREGGVWETPMMVANDGDCDKPTVFRFAGMATGVAQSGTSTAEDYTLNATRFTTCTTCSVDTGKADQCVLGEWKIANESLAEAIRLQQPDDLVQVIVQGDAAFRFGKDSKNLFGFNKYSVEGVVTADGKVRFRVYLAGTVDGDYSAAEGQLKMCYRGSEALIQIAASGGGLSDPIPFSQLPMDRSWTAEYKCAGNEMMVTQKMPDGELLTFRMERIGPAQ
ncbi:MAG: hypothetical protein KF849_04625 [Rhizobiaceae bacterium]|nr:hypothetical protein [Rhizobiaceae bacterium]